jgi:hypothetical protein
MLENKLIVVYHTFSVAYTYLLFLVIYRLIPIANYKYNTTGQPSDVAILHALARRSLRVACAIFFRALL